MASRAVDEEVFEDVTAVARMQWSAAFGASQTTLRQCCLRFDAHDFVFGPAGRTRKWGCFAHGYETMEGAILRSEGGPKGKAPFAHGALSPSVEDRTQKGFQPHTA